MTVTNLNPVAITSRGFEISDVILGTGAFGTVYRSTMQVRNSNRKTKIAAKVICFDKVPSDWKENALEHEVAIQYRVQHQHIVRVYQVVKTRHRAFIFLEFVTGSVERSIQDSTFIDEKTALRWLSEQMGVLHYLHDPMRGYCHRDIKPDNILLNESKETKLTDFGFATPIYTTQENDKVPKLCSTECGTDAYKSPELYSGKPYDGRAVDVYALGITFFEMITGREPFLVDETRRHLKLAKKQKKEYIPLTFFENMHKVKYSEKSKTLIDLMLEPDPSLRKSAADLLLFFVTKRNIGINSSPPAP